MCETVPFKLEHLSALFDQQINFGVRELVESGQGYLFEQTDAVTVFVDGKVMVCGGIGQQWPGRGHIWTMFSEESKAHFVSTFRAIRAWLKSMQGKYPRIELSVSPKFLQGHRRAQMLGFELEIALARNYLPSGETSSVYSLVRKA